MLKINWLPYNVLFAVNVVSFYFCVHPSCVCLSLSVDASARNGTTTLLCKYVYCMCNDNIAYGPAPSSAVARPVAPSSQRIIVETITMTTVTERRIVGGITDNRKINLTASQTPSTTTSDGQTTNANAHSIPGEEEAPALPPKESHAAKAMMMNADPPPDPGSLSGILKGGKLWKSETVSGQDQMYRKNK